MLRQRVLESWKKYKEKAIKLNKDIEFLDEQTFVETALPSFPTGLDTIRRHLDLWTSSNFRIKIDENKSKVLEIQNNKLSFLITCYLDKIDMFKELTEGWKKEKDSYARYRNNNSNSGPTIEEVDDW